MRLRSFSCVLAALSFAMASWGWSGPQSPAVSGERLSRIHTAVERRIADKDLSGAVTLMARDGKILHFEAHGFSDLESRKPMAKDAIFRLASMSKPITGVALLMLVEELKVRLTDPVSKFIPAFKGMKVAVPDPAQPGGFATEPAGHDITIWELLTHSSGLVSDRFGSQEARKIVRKPGENLADYIPRLSAVPLDFQPGSRSAYSATAGFETLGRIVEIVSGQPLDRFLAERLFKPLGMTDTTFALSDSQRTRRVTMYRRTVDGLRKDDSNTFLDAVYFSGAAGLLGTTEDYFRFAQMLANGGQWNGRRILSPRMVEMMGSAQIPEAVSGFSHGQTWGLGVRHITDGNATGTLLSTGSFGWSGAWGTHFWVDPKQKLVAVFMTQLSNAGGAGAETARDFETLVMQSLTDLH
jgi:CubicO group peptidase (beta-lactamase class C family)